MKYFVLVFDEAENPPHFNYAIQQLMSGRENSGNLVFKAEKTRIGLPSSDGIDFFSFSEIIYCRAAGNYTELFSKVAGKKIYAKKIGEIEDLLPEGQFFRPHNSFIINLYAVVKYIKGEGGQLLLSSGETVPVARTKKAGLLEALEKM